MDALLAECQRVIGYHFANTSLLAVALTHSSLRSPDRECNERLEFLGDSVLGLVITEELYRLLPDQAEGELTRLKSAIVSRGALFAASQRLALPRFAEFARGVGRRDELPVSVTANLVEAVIGAIYLDAGFYPAREFVLRHLGHELEDTLSDRGAKNYKSLLQHTVQEARRATPTYRTLAEGGSEHRPQFVVAALIGGQEWGRGEGPTKKEAEQEAARLALEAFERRGRGRRRRRGEPDGRSLGEPGVDQPGLDEHGLEHSRRLSDFEDGEARAYPPPEPREAQVAEGGPGYEPAPERRRVAPEPDVEPFEQGPEEPGTRARPPARTPAPARPAAPADDAFSSGIGVPAAPASRSVEAPAAAPAEPAPVRVVPSRKKAPAAWTPPPEGDGFGSGL